MKPSSLPALEDGLSKKEFCKDASDGPNVDGGGLNVPENEHQKYLVDRRLT